MSQPWKTDRWFGSPWNYSSEVLEQLRPRLHSGPPDDPKQLRSQVRVGVPVSSDDELGAWFRQIEALFQVEPKFREHRNDPGLSTDVMLRLGASDGDPVVLPVHLAPTQRQVL